MTTEMRTHPRLVITALAGLTCAFADMHLSSAHGAPVPDRPAPDISIHTEGLGTIQVDLAKVITSAPAGAMKGSGLAGACGGARVRVTATDPQEVLLPIPQLANGQVPLSYVISATPADAVTEFRLRMRGDGNAVVAVRLAGKKQEVQLNWAAVVLLTAHNITPDRTQADPYRKATACVQSGADEVTKLAATTWPKSSKAADYAANIQAHIQSLKRAERPKSLDAVGILKSGENSICTANANLAAALMRAKGVACRSVAVIPPTGQRLEMHRIAEFADGDRWVPFDPSSLTTDIPAKPWQNIVMARTTIKDEEEAMVPRMGAMLGCPYGQEAELLTKGVTLFGADFFWTLAARLGEFEVPEEDARLAAKAWTRYLETGNLSTGQRLAGSAKSAADVAELLNKK